MHCEPSFTAYLRVTVSCDPCIAATSVAKWGASLTCSVCGVVQEPESSPKVMRRDPNDKVRVHEVISIWKLLKLLPHLEGYIINKMDAEIRVPIAALPWGAYGMDAAQDVARLAYWGARSCFILHLQQGAEASWQVSLQGSTNIPGTMDAWSVQMVMWI
jgi:hypothetical protein